MSEDWKVGDLALCVDDSPHPTMGPAPVHKGSTYRVSRVWPWDMFAEDFGLELDGVDCPAPEGFKARRFRKIRPDEHESCEPEFVALLKRSKRRVSA